MNGYLFSDNPFSFDIISNDTVKFTDDAAFILGKQYEVASERVLVDNDVRSKIWFTYRKGFSPIGESGLTSDKGWGCMLRCGQMVLAQALVHIHLGKSWKWNENTKCETYLKILDIFYDHEQSPYSIHKIAQMGLTEGKDIGEWFGPNTIVQVLKKLSAMDYWGNIAIHVAMDNMVIINDIKEFCTKYQPPSNLSSTSNSNAWKPLFLAIPLRIGLHEVNPVYMENLKECLKLPQSIGIIGGRPNHAHYFIGYCGNDMIYLDPHYTQPVSKVAKKLVPEEVEADFTYHCSEILMMKIEEMDPSVAICFICKTEADFDDLCQRLRAFKNTPTSSAMFEVCDKSPTVWESEPEEWNLDTVPPIHQLYITEACDSSDEDSEEFEILG